MTVQTANELLHRLLQVTRPGDVKAILDEIGDGPAVVVGQPFGALKLQWRFVGDNPSNMSTINLASKPGRSLTERVTNAIDALLERAYHAHRHAEAPSSPLDAAYAWFGRPPTTAETGLYQLPRQQLAQLAELVEVVLTTGDESGKPTIDVLDCGIGIQPQAFGQTILSFHQGNKINKHYLAGAFGQGGSSTIAFSDFTLVVSRHVEAPDCVGFTLVKQIELGEGYKENAYVYLAMETPEGNLIVPHVQTDAALDIYPGIANSPDKPANFKIGTAVRHYGFQLGDLDRPLSPSPGNLLHLLEYMLFDPVLPLGVVDLRQPDKPKSAVVIGSRNRLMRRHENVEIRHHQPKFWIRPLHEETPSLGVEYWVVFSSLKQNGHKSSQRARPNDLFLDPAHPIIGTMHGQNHGELTARLIREAKLPQVARHLVVQLDLSQISKRVRSQLLSSTREGFKDGPVLDEVTRVLKDHFRDDEQLQAIETELQASLLGADTSHASAEVKRQISHLLKDVGVDFSEYERFLDLTQDNHAQAVRQTHVRRATTAEPLVSQPYPNVTRFAIVKPSEVLRVRVGDSRLIHVETDADNLFDRQGQVQIQVEPDYLVDIAKSSLVGGRIHWRLRPRPEAEPGHFGQITASLLLPDGDMLESHLPYEVLPAREAGIRTARGLVPNFDIQGVDPVETPQHFFRVWDYLDPNQDDLAQVAYKVVEVGNSLVVYYSTVFAPYRRRWDAIMQKQPALAAPFVQNYEIWVGYSAILQWQQRMADDALAAMQLAEPLVEKLLDQENALVAEVQARQALTVADLQRRFTDLA